MFGKWSSTIRKRKIGGATPSGLKFVEDHRGKSMNSLVSPLNGAQLVKKWLSLSFALEIFTLRAIQDGIQEGEVVAGQNGSFPGSVKYPW